MLSKVTGIILHHIKYKETSAIIHIYTDTFGRQSYLINNIRGKRASHQSNILQPLFIVEMEVYFKPGRELQRVKEISNHIPFKTIPYDVHKSAQAMFIAEVLYRSVREEESNPGLFEFLLNSIQWLDTTVKNYMDFHILFVLHLTKFLGFYPENNYSERQQFFDLRNGNFTSNSVIHTDLVKKNEGKILHDLLGKNYGTLKEMKISHSQRISIISSLLDYYKLHVQGFQEVKSLAVLRELFEK